MLLLLAWREAPKLINSPFQKIWFAAAQFVFDVVALPPETPLIRLAARWERKSSPARK